MGRPCQCCEEVSSSSTSGACSCKVYCDLAPLCTEQEFRDKAAYIDPVTGFPEDRTYECPCHGGTCSYDITTGDWSVTIENMQPPADMNWNEWEGHAWECWYDFNQKARCGKYIANGFLLPSPRAHTIDFGGEGSNHETVDQQYSTTCRPLLKMNPQTDPGAPYCAREYSHDRENWPFGYLQSTCGNNSGYACACVTSVEIDIDTTKDNGDDCWLVQPYDTDPNGGRADDCLLMTHWFDPIPEALPCACAKWSVTWKGTSTPPTPDNCRCWSFQLGPCCPLRGGADDLDFPCFVPGTGPDERPLSVCFYAETGPPGEGSNSPDIPRDDGKFQETCCGCDGVETAAGQSQYQDVRQCIGCPPWEYLHLGGEPSDCPESEFPDQGGFKCTAGACGPGVPSPMYGSGVPTPIPNQVDGVSICQYIAFGGVWYPIESNCPTGELPPCDVSDGEVITIKKARTKLDEREF